MEKLTILIYAVDMQLEYQKPDWGEGGGHQLSRNLTN